MIGKKCIQASMLLAAATAIVPLSAFAQNGLQGQSYSFQNVTIVAGGFITGFVAHPHEPGLIYVRTDIGGTYRWDASQNVWIPLTDFISPDYWDWSGTESIALDPTDPNKLYLAVGMYTASWSMNGGFLVSNNRGRTFASYQAPFQMGSNENGRNAGERLAVNPFEPNELYFSTRLNGLWKSEDGAKNWTQVTSFPITSSADGIGIVFVVFDPNNGGTIYAGANQPGSIYKSTDDGATWTALPGQPMSYTRGQTGAQG
jgi:oligoxyloglucan reducing-end-specific cellobiohydrolase